MKEKKFTNMAVLSISIYPQEKEKIRILAANKGIGMSAWMRLAMKSYAKKQEDKNEILA